MQTNSIYVTSGQGTPEEIIVVGNARPKCFTQQTDEGRQTPRFRRKDQGELTEVKRNVQGDVSQGGGAEFYNQ